MIYKEKKNDVCVVHTTHVQLVHMCNRRN